MENKESHPVGKKDAVEVVGLVLEDDGDNGGWLGDFLRRKGQYGTGRHGRRHIHGNNRSRCFHSV